MRRRILTSTQIVLALVLAATPACRGSEERTAGWDDPESTYPREAPFVTRTFQAVSGDRWIGSGISYGPYRDGQRPGGAEPSEAQLREDLHLMSEHWNLLRLYGASSFAEAILEVIRDDGIDMKVMLGAWIRVEDQPGPDGALETVDGAREANRREIEAAIHLANAYPETVLAVSVGNETQVFWSGHRSPPELLIGFIREVRARTSVPVTTADDFNFWNKPESGAVARELDFLVMHAHPHWNGLQLEDALDWTRKMFAEIQAAHPEYTVVLGETGWATKKHNEGEQAELIKGRPGEEEQELFYDALNAWILAERVPTFFFGAFDENWKGGDHPDEVEKHWGLFRADRTPKKAMIDGP